jgi:glycosyltransferase involved in cell wall biosynthesis
MAKCRVYLTTYRRNELLRRALSSLLSQTFQDWVCELHNDEPDDPFPGELLEELKDPRFIYRPHPQNYGPVKSFNLFFKPVSEPFFSILEDDNWWEPELLERLMALLESRPEASLAWANMRYWKEQEDGTWEKTDRTVWDREIYREPIAFQWPEPKQIHQALHSIGSMVVRTSSFTTRPVPESLPFFAIDPARERLYPGPLILEPTVLANFALTRQTARKSTNTEDTQASILLAWSFLRHVKAGDAYFAQIWKNAQGWPVRSSNILVIASILSGQFTFLFHHAALMDWVFFAASWLKRPLHMFRLMRSISAHPEVSRFLDEQTAEICAITAKPPEAVT